ncbi:MAG: glycosyl hydrolase 115 family protein [Prolixibacteraceae bacterium]|nr:glycosyl hydrolase 115 family protein [Prolixibacteraceae bacterium]
MKRIVVFSAIFLMGFAAMKPGNANPLAESYISDRGKSADFFLIADGIPAPIVISAFDYPGVIRVAKYFQADLLKVSGTEPKLLLDAMPQAQQVIIAGTIGKSPLIDKLVEDGKIDVAEIEGKWENSLIEVIENPAPNIAKALVIAGSDKRGTIYGLFDLSEKMGVSPWYWWADVPIEEEKNLYVKKGRYNLGGPKVKYRGIFLNDEEPCLGRWAVENYGGFNHLFYEKVFELILRLKGNYIWPAMWWASFNADDPANTALAHELGIVMGTSHHEPMDRAHAEWKAKKDKGAWNYETNAEELREFWREGIERIGNREVIVNMGMRGDGDMAMSEETNIALLEKIVKDQRKTIAEVTGKPVEETPQMWALYKEVQDYYDKGMRVPDDITLLLCDDNWGNIRKLPKPGTDYRSGGYGIYYHFDYVGGPRNYKWVNTVSVPRVWEQMNLAYEHGVKELWLVNVGDLKPMEFPISFFLDYAWNPEAIPAEKLPDYTLAWVKQQFNDQYTKDIARLLNTYTKFNSRRKPELLEPGTYSLVNYNEAERVVNAYKELADEAQKIPRRFTFDSDYADAYYQLIQHPIEACANLNELYYLVAQNRLYAEQERAITNEIADDARELFEKDAEITKYYHTELSDGKWNNMMNQTHIGYTYWQQPPKNSMPDVEVIQVRSGEALGVMVEGCRESWPTDDVELSLPVFDPVNDQTFYIELFNRGDKRSSYEISAPCDWINISSTKGRIRDIERVNINITWRKAPDGDQRVPLTITGPENDTVAVYVEILNPGDDVVKNAKGFVENQGCVAIEAPNFSTNIEGTSAKWELIPGLGRTMSAMHPVPVYSAPQTPGEGCPVLEYDFFTFQTGDYTVSLTLSPTLNIYNDEGLEVAVSVDEEEPVILNMHSDFSFHDWEEAVRTNSIVLKSDHTLTQFGNHKLRVWMVDPGVVLERITICTGEPKYSYLGPPESKQE